MDVQKTTYKITVLRPSDSDPNVGLAGLMTNCGLVDSDGDWLLGKIEIASDNPVPPEQVAEEEEAAGCDGTFFADHAAA